MQYSTQVIKKTRENSQQLATTGDMRRRTFRVVAADEGATNVEAGLPHESVSVGQCLEDEVQQLLTDETVEVCAAAVDHRLQTPAGGGQHLRGHLK